MIERKLMYKETDIKFLVESIENIQYGTGLQRNINKTTSIKDSSYALITFRSAISSLVPFHLSERESIDHLTQVKDTANRFTYLSGCMFAETPKMNPFKSIEGKYVTSLPNKNSPFRIIVPYLKDMGNTGHYVPIKIDVTPNSKNGFNVYMQAYDPLILENPPNNDTKNIFNTLSLHLRTWIEKTFSLDNVDINFTYLPTKMTNKQQNDSVSCGAIAVENVKSLLLYQEPKDCKYPPGCVYIKENHINAINSNILQGKSELQKVRGKTNANEILKLYYEIKEYNLLKMVLNNTDAVEINNAILKDLKFNNDNLNGSLSEYLVNQNYINYDAIFDTLMIDSQYIPLLKSLWNSCSWEKKTDILINAKTFYLPGFRIIWEASSKEDQIKFLTVAYDHAKNSEVGKDIFNMLWGNANFDLDQNQTGLVFCIDVATTNDNEKAEELVKQGHIRSLLIALEQSKSLQYEDICKILNQLTKNSEFAPEIVKWFDNQCWNGKNYINLYSAVWNNMSEKEQIKTCSALLSANEITVTNRLVSYGIADEKIVNLALEKLNSKHKDRFFNLGTSINNNSPELNKSSKFQL